MKNNFEKLLTFCFLLSSICVVSQTKLMFKDAISKAPVAFIMVVNEQNDIIGTSNELGEIHLENSPAKIYVESIFYEREEIRIDQLEKFKEIVLTPIIQVLNLFQKRTIKN